MGTFDLRDDGRISCEEMEQVLTSADVNRVWSKSVCEEVTREVIQEVGGSGSINFQEWLRLMRQCASRHERSCPRRKSTRFDSGTFLASAFPFGISLTLDSPDMHHRISDSMCSAESDRLSFTRSPE